MSVSLTKGGSVNLTKEAGSAGLTKLVAGAGWDAAAGKSIDLDLLAVYIGEDGKAIPDANGNGTNLDEAVIFFNNLTVPGAQHSGDNLTGEGEGDDETITFDLAAIPTNVKEVAVVVASYSGEKFSEVENAQVRMVNGADNTELAKFELKEGMGDTKGVELGRITRNGSEWEFKATGQNLSGEFKDVVASYGVSGL
jgi:tellurium resistance protein TerD